MKQLTCGSLFAGIGGFDLGFERAGIKTIWQVEIDEYCRRVLARHFPDAERFGDIRECGGLGQFRKQTANRLRDVDIIAGGFPCQDISHAGLRAGITGARSGLWSEYARIICEVRPRYVVVENVAALLVRGMERVLGDLAALGYDAEWRIISAADIGAPHIRERVWILAYPGRARVHERGRNFDAGKKMQHLRRDGRDGVSREPELQEQVLADTYSIAAFRAPISRQECDPWPTESGLARVAHGIPNRMDRIKCLGNAIVPQIAEWIGRRIIESESQ